MKLTKEQFARETAEYLNAIDIDRETQHILEVYPIELDMLLEMDDDVDPSSFADWILDMQANQEHHDIEVAQENENE